MVYSFHIRGHDRTELHKFYFWNFFFKTCEKLDITDKSINIFDKHEVKHCKHLRARDIPQKCLPGNIYETKQNFGVHDLFCNCSTRQANISNKF